MVSERAVWPPNVWGADAMRIVSGVLRLLDSCLFGFGLTGGRLTAHRVLFGLLPLPIDLRGLPWERVRNGVCVLRLFMHPELVVLSVHVPPDSAAQG